MRKLRLRFCLTCSWSQKQDLKLVLPCLQGPQSFHHPRAQVAVTWGFLELLSQYSLREGCLGPRSGAILGASVGHRRVTPGGCGLINSFPGTHTGLPLHIGFLPSLKTFLPTSSPTHPSGLSLGGSPSTTPLSSANHVCTPL